MSSPTLLAEEMQTSPHSNGEKTSNPVLGFLSASCPRFSDYSNRGCIMQCAFKRLPFIFEKFCNGKQGRSRKTADPHTELAHHRTHISPSEGIVHNGRLVINRWRS